MPGRGGCRTMEADAGRSGQPGMPDSAGGAAEAALVEEIRRWKERRRAVILAHNYQIGPIQDLADYVGDSLGLSRAAAQTDAPVIVFCGVHFMAETAAILCPGKQVLIPDPTAGCSLADTVDAEQVRRWKAEHPGAVVVAYVNTSAAVKAEADICCTSGNALQVVRTIPEDREILFLPDFFLGSYLQRVTGRRMHVWMGECHVHAALHPEQVAEARRRHPDAELLVHPECGCVTQVMYFLEDGTLPSRAARIVSTEGMVRAARETASAEVLVATEVGVLHRMRRANPDKRFIPVSEAAVCRYMKQIDLEKLRDSLRDGRYEVRVPEDVARRARRAIERMLAVA
jgi:quinolinate synthase